MSLIVTVPEGTVNQRPDLGTPAGQNPTRALLVEATLVLPSLVAQTAFAINAAIGNDAGPGTVALPLRTMREYNQRYAYQTISGPATLDLQTDVIDEPIWLVGTKFEAAATLTIRGTAQSATAGTTTVVTPFVAGTSAGFTVTTAGLDWTLTPARRMLFSDGTVGMVTRVLGANQVEMTQVGLATSGSGSAPLVATAFVAETLSAALMPQLYAVAGITTTVQITFERIAFGGAGNVQLFSGPTVNFFGCTVAHAAGAGGYWNLGRIGAGSTAMRFCLATLAGNSSYRGHGLLVVGGGFVGGTLNWTGGMQPTLFGAVFDTCAQIVSLGGHVVSTTVNVRNTASPITVSNGGRWFNNNASFAGANNTGVGITVRASGTFHYAAGANAKPILTGAAGDTLIGLTPRTYAQIPYVDLQLGAVPPLVTTLVGTPASMVLES